MSDCFIILLILKIIKNIWINLWIKLKYKLFCLDSNVKLDLR